VSVWTGSSRSRVRLGRCGESDGVAERFELSDVVSGAAFGVDVLVVVVGAEVVIAQARVGHQVPDDHQDGAGDRDEGLEFASAFDDAPVPFAQEDLGLGGARRRRRRARLADTGCPRWAVSFAARSSDSARLRSRADLIWSADRF